MCSILKWHGPWMHRAQTRSCLAAAGAARWPSHKFSAYLLLMGVFILLVLVSYSGRQWRPTALLPYVTARSQLGRRTAGHNSTALLWRQLVQTRGANRTNDARLVIYNRVDKCGSSTLISLLRRLSHQKQSLKTDHSDVFWKRFLKKREQAKIVKRLTKLYKKFPTIYDRHVNYIDFTRFNQSQPIYVNLVRDPVERFISHFYYLRLSRRNKNKNHKNGTDSAWLQKNLTNCVLDNDPECAMSSNYRHQGPFGAEFFQPMTSFFCGHEPMCREFNNRPALQKALQNLENSYAVVGILESFRSSLQVFEKYVPKYFENIVKLYDKTPGKVNKNKDRPVTLPVVKETLASRLSADIELYMFAKQRLHLQYKRMGGSVEKGFLG